MTTDIKKTLKELSEGYTFQNGIIKNPGKFEGESIATLYYYDCSLNGGESVFQVTNEEREEFKLNPVDKWVYLADSNDGFVSLVFFNTEDAAQKYANDQYIMDSIDLDEWSPE